MSKRPSSSTCSPVISARSGPRATSCRTMPLTRPARRRTLRSVASSYRAKYRFLGNVRGARIRAHRSASGSILLVTSSPCGGCRPLPRAAPPRAKPPARPPARPGRPPSFRRAFTRSARPRDAALRLGSRDSLDSMNASLVLEAGVHAIPRDERDGLLDAPRRRVAPRQHLHLPSDGLGVARVHAKEVPREQRRFLAAGAGPDLEQRILVVVRILRQKQHPDPLLEEVLLLLQLKELVPRARRKLGVGQHVVG